MSTPRFFRRRIYLDQPFNRSTQDGVHWVGSTFKAFAVIGTNNSSFEMSLVPDPTSRSVEGLPCYDGFFHNFKTLPANACFENLTAQSGVWVDVIISTEDELNLATIRQASQNEVTISGGSGFDNDKVAVTDAAAVLIPADDQRASAEIQNDTAEAFYIGTEAKISAVDFADRCRKISPGKEYVWDLPDALWARKVAVGTIEPVILTKEKP